MVSRQTARPLRKLVPAVAIGVSALLGIVGCGAGQVAQTADMEPAVNGNTGQVGNILLRDVMVAFPGNDEPYLAGDDAPLVLTIANVGSPDDELTSVTSPAGDVEIIGSAKIPAHFALQVVTPADNPAVPAETAVSSSESSETSSSETSGAASSGTETSGSNTTGSSAPPQTTTTTEEPAPDVVGTISLVIKGLKGDLPYGKTVPVTFEFAHAGKITVELPVGAPSTPRAEGRDDSEAEGH